MTTANASGSPESLMKNQEARTSSDRRERTIKIQLMPSQGFAKNFQRANNQTWEPFFTFEKNSCKSVNFKNNSISDKGIEGLLKDLTTSLKVHDVQPAETFDLNLSWSRGITNRSLTIIGSKFKRHLSSLKQLELAFYMCGHIDDNGLQLLGDNICKGLSGLRRLSLNFSRCNKITDNSVEILSSQIVKNLSNLNKLKLDFSGCERITDESLVHMAARFGRLEKLHLQFMRCDGITDNGFAQISRHLYYTKELILNFTGCTKITDKGLISFVQQTSQSLSGLDHLSLCFSECTSITDSSLEIVAQKFFNKLKNLKELVLSFSKNPKISDDALETLVTHIIEDLPKIEKLSLDFHTCDLSNRGLEKLGNQIKTGLSGLKKLRLNFSVIARTSSKAKEDLRKQLDFIPDFHLH